MRALRTLPLLLAAAIALITFVASNSPLRAASESGNSSTLPGLGRAQEPFPLGAKIYRTHCAACHDQGIARAPQKIILDNMPPEAIHRALVSGSMQAQGAALGEAQKVAVAQYLAGREMGSAEAAPEPNMCEGERANFDMTRTPPFAGWGLDQAGTHSLDSSTAGLTKANLSQLKLKWAFGFPGANRARSQPAVGGGAIFIGSQDGTVYALDRETGCVRWTFQAMTEVRTGMVLEPWETGDEDARPLLYFGDWTGNAYAVEALTGKLAWKVEADAHPAAVITGTPALWNDTVFIPVSSLEEASAASPRYRCCTFRGSILALDARDGSEKWRTWLVGEPVPRERQSEGNDYLGPSGVAVWSGMAIDEPRGQLYITTGDNYTQPATELSDAIIALDLVTGAIRWSYQATEGDAWNVACVIPVPGNCPEDAGPDYDFGAGPVLAEDASGKQYVLSGQKSGIAYANDPDTGALIWQHRVGRGGAAGGIHFGIAARDGRVFVPVSDLGPAQGEKFPASPGVYAIDIASGKRIWDAPSSDLCEENPLCDPGYPAAVTATPDMLFAMADDGHLRVFDPAEGKVLWDFDTAQEFETVNGVTGKGGAGTAGSAPMLHDGQLLVTSGYGFVSKLPGNVLLVFEAE